MTKIGLYQHEVNGRWEKLRDYWLEADRLGYDNAWMMDNTVFPDRESGGMLPVHETWTVLSILAEITENIRFGPMVTPCGRRHPALLAKMTSCIDQISNGRLDLGIGTGDDPIYFVPWGQDYPKASERVKILSEEVEVLKRMWTENEADFDGEYYTLTKATNDPKPVQDPHIPVCIGLVFGRKLMPKLAARQADAINVYNASDVAAGELLSLVEETCAETGRDYNSIPKSRSVNVIMTDGDFETSEYVNKADGSFKVVVGTPEELARECRATLDEQHQRVSAAGHHAIYGRITERHVIGSTSEIADQLREIVGDTFDQVIIHGINSIDDLHRFAEEVVPKVRGEG